MCFLTMFLTLLLIMDPIGNVSSFLNVLRNVPVPKQRWVVAREMLFALAFMLFFDVLGDAVLDLLNISEVTVRLSSGIILLLAALGILFPSSMSVRTHVQSHDAPFIVPLAVPLIAGPSLLATIMLFAHISSDHTCRIEAIALAWLVSSLILLFSRTLQKVLGNNGLMALERLLGMVLVMLATQRFLQGIHLFYTTYVGVAQITP